MRCADGGSNGLGGINRNAEGVKIRYVADARVHLPRYFSYAGRIERLRHV
jgi:hypothetical protein